MMNEHINLHFKNQFEQELLSSSLNSDKLLDNVVRYFSTATADPFSYFKAVCTSEGDHTTDSDLTEPSSQEDK